MAGYDELGQRYNRDSHQGKAFGVLHSGAAKDNFKNDYKLPPAGQEIKDNTSVAQALHAQICLVSWGNASIFDTSDIVGHYRQIIAQRHMLYSSHLIAIGKYKAGAYRSWYLGELKKQDFLVEGFDADGKAKKWGIIHSAAAAMHIDAGYNHLIQVNFKEFDQAKVAGMYELAYVYFKLYNDETDLALITKDAAAGSVEEVEVPKTETGKAPPHCAYTDPDDDMLTGYFAQEADLNMRPELLRAPAKIGVPKITGDNRRFQLYNSSKRNVKVVRPNSDTPDSCDIDYLSTDDGHFLQSRHPVCIIDPKNWKGKIGVMGDLHISSRQSLFPLANAQVIPGAKPEDSPYIGKIANQSLKSAESLLGDIGKASDLLVLAGDLYDHTRNCDPDYFVDKTTKDVKIKNTGQLWDAMNFRQYENDYKAYPREIDGLLMLERILDFYNQHKTPVIYISGNHEGYERPFGISPRVRADDDDPLIRANAGIPADHNLTIYEAALLYGDKAYDLGLELSEWKLNFAAKNFEWLYCLYTPWKDFVFSYTAKSQDKLADGKPAPDAVYNFVSLGWGGQEDFLESTITLGGTLPRAPAACDDNQVELVRSAVNAGATYNILLSHFTFACYDRDKPFSDDKAHVSTKYMGATSEPDPESPSYHLLIDSESEEEPPVKKTHYDIGSFYNNREVMYDLLKDAVSLYKETRGLISGKIHYSICGHAHRAGAYNLRGIGEQEFKVTAMLYSDPYMLDSLDLRALGGGSARCLVCGAAGPYSYKNLKGELGGFGMARPQGMILDVPNDRVMWKEATAAKPRLAVIMDYLWYVGDCPPFNQLGLPSGIWWGGEDDSDGATFCFHLSGGFKALFPDEFQQHPFACIKLIAVGTKGNATLSMYPDFQETKLSFFRVIWPHFRTRLEPGGLPRFKEKLEDLKTNKKNVILGHFLSITFTKVPGIREDDYDLTTPWCFPVNIAGDYGRIYRPGAITQGGEVPDWGGFYGKYWDDEYPKPKNPNQ